MVRAGAGFGYAAKRHDMRGGPAMEPNMEVARDSSNAPSSDDIRELYNSMGDLRRDETGDRRSA
jgi:hypothetical protein